MYSKILEIESGSFIRVPFSSKIYSSLPWLPLSVIIVDWVMRNAIEGVGEGVGFSLKPNSRKPRKRRDGSPAKLTDLDFADDIDLLSDNMVAA